VTQDPWRDPEWYKIGPITKCHGCGNTCHKTPWGSWCYTCNVERIERLDKAFRELTGE